MGSVEIRKIGITGLETDAIVNAANSGLWAGGAAFAERSSESSSHRSLRDNASSLHLPSPQGEGFFAFFISCAVGTPRSSTVSFGNNLRFNANYFVS
ncbi:MAG: hypothetical protein IKI03_08370 [Clostridia bacterium]|nr:hypothetical protein [Clostridia bacterium]